MELTDVRKALKPLGFTIKTHSSSLGRHGTIKHLASGLLMTGNVFTPESLEFWNPAIKFLREKSPLGVTQDTDKVYGLKF